MRARIDAPFATAKDTAEVLGVPNSRVKKLLKLAASAFRKNHWAGDSALHLKASNPKPKRSPLKRKATKKSGASVKRHARGKVAKAPR